jgi:type VI protein secretion system component VasF
MSVTHDDATGHDVPRLHELCAPLFEYVLFLNRFQGDQAAVNQPDVRQVQTRLREILSRIDEEARRTPVATEARRLVGQSLVFFADRVIINSSWTHAAEWREHALQGPMTDEAIGDGVFWEIFEQVLRAEGEAAGQALETMFVMAGIGFPPPQDRRRDQYRSLIETAWQRISERTTAGEGRICPEAYAVDRGANEPQVSAWIILSVVIGAIIIIATIVTARSLTDESFRAFDAIVQPLAGRSGDGGPMRLVSVLALGLGLAAVGVACAVLIFVLGRLAKAARNAKRFLAQLIQSTDHPPDGLTRSEEYSGIKDRFVRGLREYEESGKRVYEQPWYLIVGSSGTGKSEAIRNSKIEFVRNFPSEVVGVGGTLNMDWWFPVNAILIDTAGSIFDAGVKTGAHKQWLKLLDLLRHERPRRPINGVILVLPAAPPPLQSNRVRPDNPGLLYEDEAFTHKRIEVYRQRMEELSRALGVRFPVWVVVTMCDRLLGFREFFRSLATADQLQQMLGWSDPAVAGTTLNPEVVREGMRNLRRRLDLYRFRLLRDQIRASVVGPDAARQSSRLYGVPGRFGELSDAMMRYVNGLFIREPGYEPPLLRGVYFTSSMEQGGELDDLIAEQIGIAPHIVAANQHNVQRSLFLRDLLEEKVFQEKLLVTRSQRARLKRAALSWAKRIGIGASMAAAGVVLVLTFLRVQENLERNLEPWQIIDNQIRSEGPQSAGLVYDFDVGGKPVIVWNQELAQSITDAQASIASGVAPPFGGAGPTATERIQREALASVVAARVVRPLIDHFERFADTSDQRLSERVLGMSPERTSQAASLLARLHAWERDPSARLQVRDVYALASIVDEAGRSTPIHTYENGRYQPAGDDAQVVEPRVRALVQRLHNTSVPADGQSLLSVMLPNADEDFRRRWRELVLRGPDDTLADGEALQPAPAPGEDDAGLDRTVGGHIAARLVGALQLDNATEDIQRLEDLAQLAEAETALLADPRNLDALPARLASIERTLRDLMLPRTAADAGLVRRARDRRQQRLSRLVALRDAWSSANAGADAIPGSEVIQNELNDQLADIDQHAATIRRAPVAASIEARPNEPPQFSDTSYATVSQIASVFPSRAPGTSIALAQRVGEYRALRNTLRERAEAAYRSDLLAAADAVAQRDARRAVEAWRTRLEDERPAPDAALDAAYELASAYYDWPDATPPPPSFSAAIDTLVIRSREQLDARAEALVDELGAFGTEDPALTLEQLADLPPQRLDAFAAAAEQLALRLRHQRALRADVQRIADWRQNPNTRPPDRAERADLATGDLEQAFATLLGQANPADARRVLIALAGAPERRGTPTLADIYAHNAATRAIQTNAARVANDAVSEWRDFHAWASQRFPFVTRQAATELAPTADELIDRAARLEPLFNLASAMQQAPAPTEPNASGDLLTTARARANAQLRRSVVDLRQQRLQPLVNPCPDRQPGEAYRSELRAFVQQLLALRNEFPQVLLTRVNHPEALYGRIITSRDGTESQRSFQTPRQGEVRSLDEPPLEWRDSFRLELLNADPGVSDDPVRTIASFEAPRANEPWGLLGLWWGDGDTLAVNQDRSGIRSITLDMAGNAQVQLRITVPNGSAPPPTRLEHLCDFPP